MAKKAPISVIEQEQEPTIAELMETPVLEETIDVEWFKTEKERFQAIKKYNLKVVN